MGRLRRRLARVQDPCLGGLERPLLPRSRRPEAGGIGWRHLGSGLPANDGTGPPHRRPALEPLGQDGHRSLAVAGLCQGPRRSDKIGALCALQSRYCPLYDAAKVVHKQKTGKASGWQPDLAFLRELAPEADPFLTNDQLKAMATAIRQLMTEKGTQSLDQAAETGYEPD